MLLLLLLLCVAAASVLVFSRIELSLLGNTTSRYSRILLRRQRHAAVAVANDVDIVVWIVLHAMDRLSCWRLYCTRRELGLRGLLVLLVLGRTQRRKQFRALGALMLLLLLLLRQMMMLPLTPNVNGRLTITAAAVARRCCFCCRLESRVTCCCCCCCCCCCGCCCCNDEIVNVASPSLRSPLHGESAIHVVATPAANCSTKIK